MSFLEHKKCPVCRTPKTVPHCNRISAGKICHWRLCHHDTLVVIFDPVKKNYFETVRS